MNRDSTMKTTIGMLMLTVLSLQLPIAASEDDPVNAAMPAVDTSKWKCKFCEFEEGYSAELEFGVGYISDNSFKFGDYTGLHEEGGVFLANISSRYRSEDASYLDFSAADLGLDSRSLNIEGGKQGKYLLFLEYNEIPHFISDSAETPYTGSGSESLTLPAWVRAGTTGTMTALSTSLQDVNLETQRKRLGIGASFIPSSPWEYKVKFRHETKEGTKLTAGSFYFNAAQLVEPVDYVNDQLDVSASYKADKWQASLAYYLSIFRNNDESLSWDNAFTSIVAGADTGQQGLAPDNRFHQIILAGGYQLSDRTHASGQIAIGRMEQDENFLPATLNSSLSVAALPRDSLNGRVDTLNANLKAVSTVTDKLRLNAVFTYSDRDNKTPQSTYNWVTTDSFVAVPRTNLPYSSTQSALKLSADYRLAKATKVRVGLDHDTHKRTYQEIDNTTENTAWGKVTLRTTDNVDLMLKIAHAERSASTYEVVPEIDPPQNPLLTKFNMADRSRNTAGFHLSMTPRENITIGLSLDLANDDYTQSTLGLTDGREASIHADASMVLSKKTNLNFFFGQDRIKSAQAGSQTFSTPDWYARNNDSINTAGVGVMHELIEDKLDIGADYTISHSNGEVSINSGAPLPSLKAELDSLKLFATYRLKETISLRADFWHENYQSSDWTVDDVAPDTISNVITLGEVSPSYRINFVSLTLRYKF